MRAPEHFILGDSDNLSSTEHPRESLYEKKILLEVERWYEKLMEEPSIREAFALLEKLPNLAYHNRAHTEDVIREAILFVLADEELLRKELSEDDFKKVVRQQAIAAAWHDVGFVPEEGDSARAKTDFYEEYLAIERFRNSEYAKTLSHEEIWETIGNIWDTRVMRKKDDGSLYLEMSNNSRYGYMLDADVSNFGTREFGDKMKLVAEENGIDWKKAEKRLAFYRQTLGLLENHRWQTQSARELREAKKRENIAWLKEKIAELEGK